MITKEQVSITIQDVLDGKIEKDMAAFIIIDTINANYVRVQLEAKIRMKNMVIDSINSIQIER